MKQNVEDIYPLSALQEGLLFHSLYAPETGIYVAQYAGTFPKLNVSAFERAWQCVLDRHTILRTAFIWENVDSPLQVVGRQVKLPLEQEDWRELRAGEQETRFDAYIQLDRTRGFKLSKAPLMRLALFCVADETYKFVWSVHHLVMDGWSHKLIIKELFLFYDAFCQGRHLQFERPRPYRDYIAWLQQQDQAQAERYWRKTLKGFTTPTQIEADHAPANTHAGSVRNALARTELSIADTSALRSFAQEYYLTLSTIVQGAWALLLSRYSGSEDVVFGATVSGRPTDLAGVETMVGVFINTLPARVQTSSDQYVVPWLKKLQTEQAEMRCYEYSSLVLVQGWSSMPRGLALFETVAVLQNYPVDPALEGAEESGSKLEISELQSAEYSNYPLVCLASPAPQLTLDIKYDAVRFDADKIQRMLGHLETILTAMVASPDARLCQLPMLTGAERHQLIVDFNQTSMQPPEHLTVASLFASVVERCPNAVAVACRSEFLTYRELNERANQLAHYLQRRGIGSEVIVGICLPRGMQMLVAILGVLKAGGAYLPLDTSLPLERLTYMLEETQAPLILTEGEKVDQLPAGWGQVISLDEQEDEIRRMSRQEPVSAVEGENLAYVIYTSGSTGRPKGVMIEQRSVANLSKWLGEKFEIREGSKVSQFFSYNFDGAVGEMCMALMNGGRLEVVQAEGLEPGGMIEAINERDISVGVYVPSMLRQMEAEELKGSRKVIMSVGEKCEWAMAKRWGKVSNFINGYGPTECTVYSHIWSGADEEEERKVTPIGKAIGNTRTYILDETLELVLAGVIGEIYVSGEGVGRGYLNEPEMTARKFLPNPFYNDSDGPAYRRMYKTGDLGCYEADGNIQYTGRTDYQVKIRGFRIELGEIESVLNQHPLVKQAVAVAREDSESELRLVCYVVAEDEQRISVEELRQYLNENLPAYMMPSAIVTLEQMPLTSSGKIDRKGMPRPEEATAESEESYVAPRYEIEDVIAEIWARVLHVERVGVEDSFFERGGHSLLATQVISRIAKEFNVEVGMRSFFDEPTVEGLARRVVEEQLKQMSGEEAAEIIGEMKNEEAFSFPGD